MTQPYLDNGPAVAANMYGDNYSRPAAVTPLTTGAL